MTTPLTIGAVSAAFGRDIEFAVSRVGTLIEHARRDGVGLLVLPDAALGGYLSDLDTEAGGSDPLPPALRPDDPVLVRVRGLAGEMVVCLGYREEDADGATYNTAVALCGDGVLGTHRKVHQPPGETRAYRAGDGFAAFDTPVGRLGMMIDYDKTFPEAARSLAVDGAEVLACLSAWPTSITNRAPRINQDRQSRLFDLYDRARAAENQVVLASSNQTGTWGRMRFLGQAKIVGPGGDVLARTWAKAGIAIAEVDVGEQIGAARRVLNHLEERRPGAYR